MKFSTVSRSVLHEGKNYILPKLQPIGKRKYKVMDSTKNFIAILLIFFFSPFVSLVQVKMDVSFSTCYRRIIQANFITKKFMYNSI
jgi:hypothetical protein